MKHDYEEATNRYWLNKDKFWEFQQEYDEMQEEQQKPASVEMHIIVEMKTLADKKIILKDTFTEMKNDGGLQGAQLYLKHKVIDIVYAWEDSGAEIQEEY